MASIGGNSVQKWGAFNFGSVPAEQDGYFFAYDGTNISVNVCNNGVTTSFTTLNVTNFTVDTKAHNYEIIYQVASVAFVIDNILVHRMSPNQTLLSSTLTLACSASSTNTTATTGNNLEVWAMSIVRYGSTDSSTQVGIISTNTTTTFKLGPGLLQTIFIGTASTAGNTVTVYDSTTASGKIITVLSAGASGGKVAYDFINGLTVISAGGTPGNYSFIFE
jgi:hypothetical protein